MFLGYQIGAYQAFAYQTITGNPANDNGWLGGKAYGYVTPYKKYAAEESQREKIAQEKSELDKLESVLKEAERKKQLAAQNRLIANERRALELAALELEYLNEINRLLMVRGELIRRIKEDEAILIILMVKRRRSFFVA